MTLAPIGPVRMKRRKVPEPAAEAAPPEAAPPEAAPPEAAPPESAPPDAAPLAPTASTRGILRKSAVRRWFKQEAAQPVKIRDAFFTALELKVTDLARSLARAREQKRSTLMSSDA
jgi:hypothetical protein